MLHRLLLIAVLLLLSACQSIQTQHDYDTNRNFSAYHSWSWQEPALQYRPDDPRIKSDLTELRVRQAIAEQLDQHGLRSAQSGSVADLKVQIWLIVEQRQDQISTQYGGYWGGFWGGPAMSKRYNLDYQIEVLQIDLMDSRDGKLVWRGSAEQIMPLSQSSPAEREQAIRSTVAEILKQYPPQ